MAGWVKEVRVDRETGKGEKDKVGGWVGEWGEAVFVVAAGRDNDLALLAPPQSSRLVTLFRNTGKNTNEGVCVFRGWK